MSQKTLPPGTKVKIRVYPKTPDFWADDGSMNKYMGETLTILKMTNDGLYKMIEDPRWVFRRSDFEVVESNLNPNILFIIHRKNKNG
jgi:hypothetical protein